MSNSDVDFQAIPKSLRKGAAALLDCLQRVAGGRLLSHTAFGLALSDGPAFDRAVLESVAVLSEVNLDLIHELAIEGQQLGRYQVRAPLIMTPAYIQASCDAFPVELLEIQQLRAVLLGQDFFADLRFDRHEMRLQCERELKRALIHLRQGLLASGGKDHLLPDLTGGVMEQTLRVLRGLLWLGDHSCPRSAAEIVRAAEHAGRLTLPGLSAGVQRPTGDPYATLENVYQDLEALAHHVNEMAV